MIRSASVVTTKFVATTMSVLATLLTPSNADPTVATTCPFATRLPCIHKAESIHGWVTVHSMVTAIKIAPAVPMATVSIAEMETAQTVPAVKTDNVVMGSVAMGRAHNAATVNARPARTACAGPIHNVATNTVVISTVLTEHLWPTDLTHATTAVLTCDCVDLWHRHNDT